jgi:hypothetical protein
MSGGFAVLISHLQREACNASSDFAKPVIIKLPIEAF